uniref:Transcription termination factor MTERF8, chloroplastic n=1 Tax=Tanacetum cinerariifolium TaxID=118510 RepID=A0A699J530_TANCI|nr:transcription termination factor MTERF8, chloroplastic [Tanacetum cinerariifolium]
MSLSKSQIANLFSRDPQILTCVSIQSHERSVKVLKKVLGDNLYDSRILNYLGWFLQYSLDKTLMPNVELMKRYGIEQSHILKLFYNYPKLLLHKSQTFKECVRRVNETGVDTETKSYVYAIKTISSMSFKSWEQKLDVFRRLGYTNVDIILTFRRLPNVFAVSERKIKRTAEFLLNIGKFDLSYVLRYPHILMYSLERRLKPRLRVLEIFEREKILEFKPNSIVFTCSDSKFFGKLVRPHMDKVEELSFDVKDART